MEKYFKSIIDQDLCPIVICNIEHEVIYMNPAAAERYVKRGGYDLVGKSLLDCHNEDSNIKIKRVMKWFMESPDNNRIFTFHNSKENKDVYMVALRNEKRELIGYYEKHEIRNSEIEKPYGRV